MLTIHLVLLPLFHNNTQELVPESSKTPIIHLTCPFIFFSSYYESGWGRWVAD